MSCRGCGAALGAPFLDLGRTPLANAYVRPERAAEPEPTHPLAVAHCAACHLVQLTSTVPPEAMFSEYLYFSSYSDTFLAHAEKMAETLVASLGLGPTSRVLEVASNDGYLLQFFQRAGLPVLGVEPAQNVAREAVRRGIPTLNRFFGPEAVPEIVETFGTVQLLVGNNVLAHVPDLVGFLSAVRDVLAPDGVAVFEVPSLEALLDRIEFDTIYHEHVYYFSLAALTGVAARAGLEAFDVSIVPVHGESLRVSFQKEPHHPIGPSVPERIRAEEAAGLTGAARYRDFAGQVAALKAELVAMLRALRQNGRRLAAYGAPAKGNTLLNYCGIGADVLEFTVDRSPHKQGLLLPGSKIPILAPEELLRRRPDAALLLPWNLADEIARQQRPYLEAGGRFIVPIPRPREIGGPA